MIRSATLKASIVILVLLLSNSASHAADLSAWRVIQIPGATDVESQGANASGMVAGTYSSLSGGLTTTHGFIRNQNGSITSFDVGQFTNTVVAGINDQGEVVGNAGNLGFIRESDGTVNTVAYPPQSDFTAIAGINNLGQIIGSGGPQGGLYFMTTTDGKFVSPPLPPFLGASLRGINNSDEIVGSYSDRTGMRHGFLLEANGAFTTIDIADSIGTLAQGINDAGQIVGYYGTIPDPTTGLEQNHGFIRDTDGTITTFDAPYLGSTQPNGISTAGMIVASFSRNPGNGIPNIGLVRACLLCP